MASSSLNDLTQTLRVLSFRFALNGEINAKLDDLFHVLADNMMIALFWNIRSWIRDTTRRSFDMLYLPNNNNNCYTPIHRSPCIYSDGVDDEGTNVRAAPFMQYRRPVGSGPSGKTCPKCPWQV